jgi:hypothetical protein
MSLTTSFKYKEEKRRDSATKLPPISLMNPSLLYKVPTSNSVLKADHSLRFIMENNDQSVLVKNLDQALKSGQTSNKNNPLMNAKSLHESLDRSTETLSEDKSSSLKIKTMTGNFQLKPIAKSKLKTQIEIDVKPDLQSFLNNIKLKEDSKDPPGTEKSSEKNISLRKNSKEAAQVMLKRNSPIQRKNKFYSHGKLHSMSNINGETPKSNSVGPISDWVHNNTDIPKVEASRHSNKKNGYIKSYAANTHQGLIRNYNEDRVSIVLNITKPPSRSDMDWPMCSFFAVYDGHGGTRCAEFLRDNLHNYVRIIQISINKNPQALLLILDLY